MHFDRFVDDIYEAAVIPERWFGVLDELAHLADAEGTLLFAAAPGEQRRICSEQIRPRMQAWVDSPYCQNNPAAGTWYRSGPVLPEVTARLDPLRPHLVRAALLAARFGLRRARATVEALNLIGLPAAVLADRGGRWRRTRGSSPMRPTSASERAIVWNL